MEKLRLVMMLLSTVALLINSMALVMVCILIRELLRQEKSGQPKRVRSSLRRYETGVFKPSEDRGNPHLPTQDELEYAFEQGARDVNDALAMLRQEEDRNP